MPKTLIASNPLTKREIDKNQPFLKVAEMFSRTIQGEGISTGVPSTFLRLKDCSLACEWCDSMSVWKFGNSYTIDEILDILKESGTVEDFRNGHHFILTGGSPLLQQENLSMLIWNFVGRFGFKPFIEIENECVIEPTKLMTEIVDQWNNSPKTFNSGMKLRVRYKPEVIQTVAKLKNSWFKFVIGSIDDWMEVQCDFLDTGLIQKEQVILMPCGANQEELKQTRELVVELAIEKNVRFSDREHISIWDKKTGV